MSASASSVGGSVVGSGRSGEPPAGAARGAPAALRLAAVPALIALGITLARLGLEFFGAPGWLASSNMGGGGALLGVVWLPLFVVPYFAYRLRPHLSAAKPFWLRLWKTATVFGLLSRAPIFLITVPAVVGEWGTHYDKFPGMTGVPERIFAGFVAQLGFWACLWTPVVGLLAARIALWIRPAALRDA